MRRVNTRGLAKLTSAWSRPPWLTTSKSSSGYRPERQRASPRRCDFDASCLRTYDTDKNMTGSHLVETWTGGGLTFDASYPDYDTTSNPFTLVATAMGQPYYFPRGEGFADDRFLFKNNPTKQLGDRVADFDYQYNTKNYPTKAIATPSSGSTIVVKTTFEYANCD
ncbi:MAG TPA: hypothetical protein VFW11_01590 [Cyclobacteriaceae bacterium]|nr:hypothetical protein [Cyclobacteriaceae bacterium]